MLCHSCGGRCGNRIARQGRARYDIDLLHKSGLLRMPYEYKKNHWAKTYLTHLSSPAILYKGITNPYHYLPIAMTKP